MERRTCGRLGFAGLGAMGFGMATNLLQRGHEVVGFDVWAPTLEKFRSNGGRVASSPRDAASDIFILMVATAQQVESVLFDGSNGAAQSLPKNALVLICSTVPAAFVNEVKGKLLHLKRDDVQLVDCPVSGGTVRAAQGTLTILAAGEDSSLRRAEPILRELSEKLYVIPGGLGAASNVKMINQLLVGSHIAAAAEAMGLASKAGLNTKEVFDLIRQSTGNSWAFNHRVPHMLDNDWTPLSALNIFVKDMGIVTSAARRANFPVPVANVAEHQYLQGAAQGLGREDDAGVVRVYLPENHSAVHDQARPGVQGAELTPTVTPVEISRVGVLETRSSRCRTLEMLRRSGYAIQEDLSTTQILLVEDSDVEDVLFGQGTVAQRLPNEAIVILTSTCTATRIRAVQQRLDHLEKGIELVDAPHPCPDVDGHQVVICSGPEKALAAVSPILASLNKETKSVFRVRGGTGAASTLVMIKQMLIQLHLLCAAEAMAFAAKLGLNVHELFKIIRDAAGWSWMFENRVPQMLGDSEQTLGRIEESVSSLQDFAELATSLSYPAAMANTALQIYTLAAAINPPESADTRVVRFYEMAGVSLNSRKSFQPRRYEIRPAKATLQALPEPYAPNVVPAIQSHIRSGAAPVLVVLDDDPTGTQTCHDIAVLAVWDHDTLCKEFNTGSNGFFILTNSRAFSPQEAYDLILQISRNVANAAKECGKEFEIVLRGDSTLRGHLPQEPEAVEEALGKFDGWIVTPFFYQGGRYTINDVHYVKEGDKLIPASDTPFAQDASFGYRSSNLRDYVLEKCGSRFTEKDMCSISIEDIRLGGPSKIAQRLLDTPKGSVVIVNAAAESDMYVFAAGLLEAEKNGKRFLYRTGAAFVSARLGIESIEPLTMLDLGVERAAKFPGGLIVAGSYVPKTTAQLEQLKSRRGDKLFTIELDVERLIKSKEDTEKTIREATKVASEQISRGQDVLVMTSRKLIIGDDALSSLNIGSTVAAALVRIVENIEVRPRYVIAKGGITSSDTATKGLKMKRARVLGQAAKGVPLWRCDEPTARHVGVPYVVFPGNVGTEETLAELVERWSFD